MKLSVPSKRNFLFIIVILIYIINLTRSTETKTEFNLKNHFAMMMQFKSQTKNLLNNLYRTANTHTVGAKGLEQIKNKYLRTKYKVSNNARRSMLKSKTLTHSSDITKKSTKSLYIQYRYKRYQEIVDMLHSLSKEFPDYLKIDTAQNRYNLPNPGGYCGPNKKKCKHWIAFLSNHKIEKKNKHQIFLSGEVHGDEHIGPTAMIEMIELILKNKDNPWFNHLLDNRYIVIVPMTNPHGYYEKIREELLIKDEDAMVLTKRRYEKTHKDINRDFPYLVKPENCMETIGARVVNELYINHLFSLALSLHGGTESLTYPYGTPNHMIGNITPKIPMKYTSEDGNLTPINRKESQILNLVKKYRTGKYDMINGKSSESPDNNTLRDIAESASTHTTDDQRFKYVTGDMNGVVYPVTGGMEDWAYSGSWEGAPIITQPCKPKTYGGYDKEKTLYDKNYRDSLKSIMFLLEVSHEKIPEQKFLGRQNWDCLINIRRNAFFNDIAANKKKCLDPLIDGYIPRIIRLSLLLIDILKPYVNHRFFQMENGEFVIQWAVGGAINVDETFLLYGFFNKLPTNEQLNSILAYENPAEAQEILKNRSDSIQGKAIWHENFSDADFFNYRIPQVAHHGKYIVTLIYVKVDQDWGKQVNPDPQVPPQTHIANIRTNDKYSANNNGYQIKGHLYYKSKLSVLDTNNLNSPVLMLDPDQ